MNRLCGVLAGLAIGVFNIWLHGCLFYFYGLNKKSKMFLVEAVIEGRGTRLHRRSGEVLGACCLFFRFNLTDLDDFIT